MRIGIVGINHKLADITLREALAKVCQHHFSTTLHAHHAFVLLSTCNRTELYFSSDDPAVTHSYILQFLNQQLVVGFDQKLYSFFGLDCFTHLIEVTAGLDSAIVGETEIQGQVKLAYYQAQQSCRLPYDLHYLFQKSLKIAKTLRAHFPVDNAASSLENALYSGGKAFFSHTPAILFVGASAINLKILRFFKQRNAGCLTICNRTDSKSTQIASKLSIQTLPWRCLNSDWDRYDWVICATKAPGPILTTAPTRRKLIIDLSVPRNVDTNITNAYTTLWDIDAVISSLHPQQCKRSYLAEQHALLHANKHFCLFQRKVSPSRVVTATLSA